MPRQTQTGRRDRSVTLSDDNWEPGELIAETLGTTRSQLVEAFWAWFMRRPEAELPQRPSQELVDHADALWAEQKSRTRALALMLKCPQCGVTSGPCLTGKGRAKRPSETMIHRARLVAAGRKLAEVEAQSHGAGGAVDRTGPPGLHD